MNTNANTYTANTATNILLTFYTFMFFVSTANLFQLRQFLSHTYIQNFLIMVSDDVK